MVGVIPRGQVRISSIVSYKADKIVHCNTESIVPAVQRNIK